MRAVDEKRALELAMNESAARTSNERLSRMAVSHRFAPFQRVPFICECADATCFEIVMLNLEQYERVRTHPSRFLLVAPGTKSPSRRSPKPSPPSSLKN